MKCIEMDEMLLQIRNLGIEFDTDEGIVKALDSVSLDIQRGKILGLVGETGCGKSVTAHSILRLIPQPPGKIVSGEILLGEKDLLKVSKEDMRKIRGKEISMIFQDPFNALNPVYTIGDQIIEAIELHQSFRGKRALEKAVEILEMVRFPDASRGLMDYPHQLSGGMRQRVMIAIALSCNPSLLIADEPTTGLDVTIQAQILDLMVDLNRKIGTAILLISHDLGIISEICDIVGVMYAGNIVELAEMDLFFSSHQHPYSEGLLKSIPLMGEAKEVLSVIPGNVPNLLDPPSGCRFHPRCRYVMDRCRNGKPILQEIAPGHKVACYRLDN